MSKSTPSSHRPLHGPRRFLRINANEVPALFSEGPEQDKREAKAWWAPIEEPLRVTVACRTFVERLSARTKAVWLS